MTSFSDAVQRYASNMKAAGLDVVVTLVAPGQVQVSGRVQAFDQHGADLACAADEGSHDGRAMTIVYSDTAGVAVARAAPYCRRHADQRAASWNALRDPDGWTAAIAEADD